MKILKNLYRNHKDIARKENILKSLREKSTSIGGVEIKEKVKSYSIKSIVENNTCRIIFIENELEVIKKEFEENKKKVIECIDKLENQAYKDILFLRYICFEKWDDIAGTVGYSKRYTLKQHSKALEEISKILKEDIVGHSFM